MKKKRNRRNFDQLFILAVIFILPFAITVIQSDQPKQTPFIGCAHILCLSSPPWSAKNYVVSVEFQANRKKSV